MPVAMNRPHSSWPASRPCHTPTAPKATKYDTLAAVTGEPHWDAYGSMSIGVVLLVMLYNMRDVL